MGGKFFLVWADFSCNQILRNENEILCVCMLSDWKFFLPCILLLKGNQRMITKIGDFHHCLFLREFYSRCQSMNFLYLSLFLSLVCTFCTIFLCKNCWRGLLYSQCLFIIIITFCPKEDTFSIKYILVGSDAEQFT